MFKLNSIVTLGSLLRRKIQEAKVQAEKKLDAPFPGALSRAGGGKALIFSL